MDPIPERAMSTAMKMEQTGSAIIHPNICMRMADTITPTLPRVSARMCRNTPCTQHNNHKEDTISILLDLHKLFTINNNKQEAH